ncbi:MAG TPA: glycosyltransferase [Gemmataceae bacterium]|jgi:glycosyltransferase involved in cell wall biosynthesis|nr:glycosyltransferase [Gemmataceae bacterium]
MTAIAQALPKRPSPVDVVRINSRLNVGGIARHVAWLSAGLESKGYWTLLVAGRVPTGEADMRPFVEAQGVAPLYLTEMSREISPKDLVTVWKLFRLLQATRPRIVHTHAAKAGAVGRAAAWLYRWATWGTLIGRPRRVRVVHTFHGHIFHSYYGRLKTWAFLTVERLLARLATDRIVAISPKLRDEIQDTYRVGRADQFAVIPLGLDLSAYARWAERPAQLRAELGARENDVLVGIVGRLTEIKDHALFLEVAARYRAVVGSAGQRVRFVIVGDGHLRGALEQKARELNLTGVVNFLGMRDDPEVFYPGLDVVALTSKNEGTPLTLIEGMANARPAIATDVGGVSDLLGASGEVGDGFAVCQRGLLVRSGDADAFARGLARLVDDSSLRRTLGARGLAFVTEQYSKDRLLDDMAELYAELLDLSNLGSNQTSTSRTQKWSPYARVSIPAI